MIEARGPDTTAGDKRKQLIRLFLQRTLGDIEQMRRDVPQLIAGQPAAWQELRFASQRAAGMARSFDLEVLANCVADLAALAEQRFAGAALEAQFLWSTTTAIEVAAIEANRLLGELE
ncbi:MAG TPA: hypothetical protein VFP37_10060 [Steroidobacteraceae bacterium]|nr:hypothetical protein [Steroidobacteraceae bacterium]